MQESLFNEYNMEGVSTEHNQIFVEFSPDTLHKVGVRKIICINVIKSSLY